MNPLKILIADDEDTARDGLFRALKKSYAILQASDGLETWNLIQSEQPDIVLLDLNMPKMGGFQVLKKVKSLKIPPLIIMITAYGSERVAVDAMKAGAYEYISKPFQLDEIRMILANAKEKITLRQEVKRLKEVIKGESHPLMGDSKGMVHVKEIIDKIAPTDVTILITGESGTGKELAARAIHQAGVRRHNPFIAVNCAALPADLIESELFGYKKGAFTGAIKDTPGKFELAHGGTLFLDEIGDMSSNTQAKVLRAIEERKITPLGSSEIVNVDVRIISATNKDLLSSIGRGDFREDLYYRIRIVEIHMPPLRERPEDILPLADHFLNLFVIKYGKAGIGLTPAISKLLKNYSWPGNVRELRNKIESMVVLSTEELDETAIQMELQSISQRYSLKGRSFQEAKQVYVEPVEKDLIAEAMIQTQGNISKAAGILGMKRQYLQQKLKQLKMVAHTFK